MKKEDGGQAGTQIVLNPQQAEAVKTVKGPVLLLAVPGSGKTTVLVLRLGYMIRRCGIAPENILTVTYTVAATRDMARRFAGFFGDELAARLEFRTINGICAKIIGYYSRVLGRRAFELVTDEKRLGGILAQIYQDVEETWPTEADLKNVRTLITYIKNQMLSEQEIRALSGGNAGGAQASRTLTGGQQKSRALSGGTSSTSSASGPLREDCGFNIAAIYERYNRYLREQHLMDYDDQMVYALNILRKVPQVLAHFQDLYRYICVDEAQDTSKIQHAIIALLASRDGNLFMVGDEDQSIYGFRAAYPEALLNFEKDHPGAKILMMEQNYRSRSGIVSAADRFIQRNTLRHEKHMVCAVAPIGNGFGEIDLRSGTGVGNSTGETDLRSGTGVDGSVKEIYLRSRRAQYKYLVKVAEGCTEETAVLYRNHESAIPLVDLLAREGIPYRIRNAEPGFFTHRTVLDIANIIRLAYDPYDVEAFWAVYYKLGMYLSKEKAALSCEVSRRREIPVFDAALRYANLEPQVAKNVKSVRTHLSHMKEERGDRAVLRIVRNMGYGEYLSRAGIKDNKVYVLTTIGANTETPAELLERLSFLEEVFRGKNRGATGAGAPNGRFEAGAPNERFGAGGAAEADCRFILSTIHASKGLEYDTVYLMDVLDGIFPEEVPASTRYMSKEERRSFEEERRLFYVGMTRARNKLCVFTTDAKSVLTDELFGAGSVKRAEAEKAAAARGNGSALRGSGSAASRGSGSASRGGGSPARAGSLRKESARKARKAFEGTAAEAGRGGAGSSASGSGHGKVSAAKLAAYARKLQPGQRVIHVVYGFGMVVSQDGKRVRIRFEDDERVMDIGTLYRKKLLR